MCLVMWGTEKHHGVVLKLCCCLEVRCSDGAELHFTVRFSLFKIRMQELSEVRADPNGVGFRSWLCLSAAAKHVLNVKCLGNTMRCWDYTEVFGMPPSCAHAKGKACCKLFRHQADSSSLSPTHIEVSVCARISLCILGLADVLSNTSVCRYATEQHEMCGKECREAAQPARAIHHWSIAIAVWCMSVGINL